VKHLALALCSVVLTGCVATTQQSVKPVELGQPSTFQQLLAALAGRGPGLAEHDPTSGNLFDQIPAWDRAAEKRCCSVLTRDEFLALRCDTNQPIGGRTNRC